MPTLSLTEEQCYIALKTVLAQMLPALGNADIVQGQTNRVAEPVSDDFVVMTTTGRRRIETNTDSFVDAVFTGNIAADVMTIATVERGALLVGSVIFGVGVAAGTTIIAFGSGTGGAGTYTVSPAQNIGSEALAAGVVAMLQPTELHVQIDVHGPLSGDNAQIISTMFRDAWAVDAFQATPYDVWPIDADDPRQVPFTDGEQQVEQRWVIDAVLQVNPIVTTPQQFFDAIDVEIISVEAEYPPA